MNNGKHGHGTHYTKMGADSLIENTPNAPGFILTASIGVYNGSKIPPIH